MYFCGRTIGLTALLLAFITAPRSAQPRRQDPGDAAMAEHLALLAQSTLRHGPSTPQQLAHAAALIEAATRLNPNEERFARLLADACLSAGDGPAALAALNNYRRLAPGDVHAQIQSIQLYAAGMNTSEQQVAYLSSLVDKTQVSPDVRAYAATALARLRFERSEVEHAHRMLDKALELNPLDIDALHLALERDLQQDDRPRRVQAMLNVLRANPVQPRVCAQLAGELSRAGLSESAAEWYVTSIGLYTRLGQTPALELIRD